MYLRSPATVAPTPLASKTYAEVKYGFKWIINDVISPYVNMFISFSSKWRQSIFSRICIWFRFGRGACGCTPAERHILPTLHGQWMVPHIMCLLFSGNGPICELRVTFVHIHKTRLFCGWFCVVHFVSSSCCVSFTFVFAVFAGTFIVGSLSDIDTLSRATTTDVIQWTFFFLNTLLHSNSLLFCRRFVAVRLSRSHSGLVFHLVLTSIFTLRLGYSTRYTSLVTLAWRVSVEMWSFCTYDVRWWRQILAFSGSILFNYIQMWSARSNAGLSHFVSITSNHGRSFVWCEW